MTRLSVLHLAVVLLLFGVGCTFQIQTIEQGTRLDPQGFAGLMTGSAGRAEIIERLGPPDDVRYTVRHEELIYRGGHHNGTDVVLMLPTDWIPGFSILANIRSTIEGLFPARSDPDAFAKGVGVTLPQRIMQSILGAAGPGATDLLSLHGRRLRQDRMRFVLDRDSLVLVEKSYEPARSPEGTLEVLDAALLQD